MINIIKKVSWYIKQEWRAYLIMFVFLIIITLLALTPAYILGMAIDVIVSKSLTFESLLFLLVGLVLVPFGRYTSSYIYNYTLNKTSQKLAFQMRQKYLKKLFSMDAEFYEKYQKGDLISRATNDLDSITIAATSMIEGIVLNVAMILVAITIMASTISWQLTVISVTIMPIGLTILNFIRMKKRAYVKKHRIIYAKMTEKILESVEGQKTIRAYVQEDTDLQKQYEAINGDIESWRYIINYENRLTPLFEMVYGIAYILAFVFGSVFIMNQMMTVGQLVTFVSYIGMLYGPIIGISGVFQQINNATVAIDRFYEIMDIEPKVTDDKDNEHIMSFNSIEFKDVTFKYPFDHSDTIQNINLKINHGETLGVVGPTGSGKSTLIRQLLREFNVTSGRILIDQKDIKKYNIKDLRNMVGYVPQSHMLFRRGVDDNIMIGNPTATIDQLNRAIKVADFEKDLNYLSEGVHTKVGEGGATLSGGQKQRLSIARALVREPEILILDDSLSAVDAKTEENIIDQLKQFRKNKTNIIIAHRFSAVRDADHIIVMNKGRIIDEGTHEELVSRDGWYKDQYIKQMSMK
ncbi:ABC transporter ATP-binding protein [Acholeplasma equirhinis]|uniref:ABC transporter ATP-binding protein n=1 Tax=Acholeplasma equirhinis TaxID=555393 RepID=UPI00197AFE1B|nr:ABC transporter ATP-binding protein [Acholeplasma equirhinis]MBN3490576.1 ABC transporter ATP-binding protein [Acholeplasma equirhinis]